MSKQRCSIPGCLKFVYAKFYCKNHYSLNLTKGSPYPRKKKVVATVVKELVDTYRTIHVRVAELNGSAKWEDCIHCGEYADHWAYYHWDAYEICQQDGYAKGRWFSTNLDNYKPLCVKCHRSYDAIAFKQSRESLKILKTMRTYEPRLETFIYGEYRADI